MTWQPIETAPKDGTEILLVCQPDGEVTLKPKYGVGFYTAFQDDGILWDWPWGYKPTHWQPLPPPPEPTP